MPTYHRAKYLHDTIPLILAQTFQDFELVICDDASPDDTEDVVRGFQDPRIRYYRNARNLNIPGNLNRILQLASGELIVMLHDHDRFHPTLLEKMVRVLDQNPEVGFVHPGVAWVDADGSNYRELLLDFEEVCDGDRLVRSMFLADDFSCPVTACAMVRRSAHENVGFEYDPRFGFLSDVDLWFRLAARGPVGYVREPLITCRGRDESHQYAGINWNMVKWSAEIHEVNLDRYRGTDPTLHRRLRRKFEQKRAALYRRCTLYAAANDNLDAFREGLRVMEGECVGWERWLAVRMGRRDRLHGAVLSLSGRLNRLRTLAIRTRRGIRSVAGR